MYSECKTDLQTKTQKRTTLKIMTTCVGIKTEYETSHKRKLDKIYTIHYQYLKSFNHITHLQRCDQRLLQVQTGEGNS